DWIVMKSLDKDRNRRFETANALAADVERFLKDEPVQACPPSLGYRLRKYARKNKVGFTVGATVAATLLIGIITTSWQAIRATRAESVAEHDRDVAAAESDKAQRALASLELSQKETRATQYASDMQMMPLAWEAGSVLQALAMLGRQPHDLRGFEWHYWNRQTHAERDAFTMTIPPGIPDDPVSAQFRSVAWFISGDGHWVGHVASPRYDQTQAQNNTLLIWNVPTRTLRQKFSFPLAEIEEASRLSLSISAAMSQDGKRVLLNLTYRGGFRPAGEPGQRLMPPRTMAPRTIVRVLDVDSGREIFNSWKELGHDRVTSTGRLSPDGRRLVTL